MQRRLTSGSSPAPHPFRSQMRRARVDGRRRDDDSDIKLFATSFIAFFICLYTFLL